MPEVAHQLLSLTMLMQEGWEMKTVQSDNLIKSTIELPCDNKRSKVDQIIISGESAHMGVKLNRKFNYANVASTKKKKMTYEDFHSMIGHCGNDLIASTAKTMGIELIGKTFKCLNCTIEKIQKTKILKESEKCSTVKGE